MANGWCVKTYPRAPNAVLCRVGRLLVRRRGGDCRHGLYSAGMEAGPMEGKGQIKETVLSKMPEQESDT